MLRLILASIHVNLSQCGRPMLVTPLRVKGVDGCKPCGTQTPSYQNRLEVHPLLSPHPRLDGWNKDVVRLAHGDGLPT